MTREMQDPWADAPTDRRFDSGPFDRPPRTEDLIQRRAGKENGQAKVWVPDGSHQEWYFRPSSWGEAADDKTQLEIWKRRMLMVGFFDLGNPSRAFRARRAGLGPLNNLDQASRTEHNKLNDEIISYASDWAAQSGTAVHAMTERHDLGLPLVVPDDYEVHLKEWERVSRYFEIVDIPIGDDRVLPGVEVFVAFDEPRLDLATGEQMVDHKGKPVFVRGAGTFDRLWRYQPCAICGRSNRIVDLKSGKNTSLEWSEGKYAVQTGVYGNAKAYVPWPDGTGADRYPLPDTCPHSGIIVSIDAETGLARTYFIDIVRGAEAARRLIPAIRDHTKKGDWMREFTPVPNLALEIDRCETPQAVRALWKQYPGDAWNENDGALTTRASARIELLTTGVIR